MRDIPGRIIKQERRKEEHVGFVTRLWVGDDLIRICPARRGVRRICFHKYDSELSRILGEPVHAVRATYTIESRDSLKSIINDINIGFIGF